VQRNRQRIIAAAQHEFAQRGLDVPVEDIARHAGVGVATLYRRFPSRADLIAGAFEAKMTAYADAVTQALADPDPWAGSAASPSWRAGPSPRGSCGRTSCPKTSSSS